MLYTGNGALASMNIANVIGRRVSKLVVLLVLIVLTSMCILAGVMLTCDDRWMEGLHIVLPTSVLVIELIMFGVILHEASARKKEEAQRDRVMQDLNSFRISIGRAHYMRELRE